MTNDIRELNINELDAVSGGEIVGSFTMLGVTFGMGTTPNGGVWVSETVGNTTKVVVGRPA
jgi:bacteriocin-like protein